MSKFATSVNRKAKPARVLRTRRAVPLVTTKVPVARPASTRPIATNLAGGVAYKMSDKMEFATGVFASLLSNKQDQQRGAYETEATRKHRLRSLVPSVGAEFAAKVLLSARIQHGLRSITHAIAPWVIKHGCGQSWVKDFVSQLIVRPDDGCEILGCHWTELNKDYMPKALQKGIAKSFDKFDHYRIAKYAGGQRSPNLVDLVNLCHPKPNKKNAKALKELTKGTIKQEDTWEAKLSEAGQQGKSKKEAWAHLVNEEMLGHLGLLRNLRNIATECELGTLKKALTQLTDPVKLKKSGILPFQFLTAYEILSADFEIKQDYQELILAALNEAMEICCENVTSIGDKVLIAIDESGSMGPLERKNAAIFAGILLKANKDAHVMYFASHARYHYFNRRKPLMELIKEILGYFSGGGTNFNLIFEKAEDKYDTIVILSDQEGWMAGQPNTNRGGAPINAMNAYNKKYGVNPMIFTFDLGGDGSLMFREDGIIALAGFSFHVFSLLNVLKRDRVKLVDEIDKIQIGQPLPSLDDEDSEG